MSKYEPLWKYIKNNNKDESLQNYIFSCDSAPGDSSKR